MVLTAEQLYQRIDDLHLDDLDLLITREGHGFAATPHRGARGYVSDIGSSFELPDNTDEHGRRAFTAGPWTAYRYHAAYVAPRRDNYTTEITELAAGHLSAVIVGVAAVEDSWVLGIRTEA